MNYNDTLLPIDTSFPFVSEILTGSGNRRWPKVPVELTLASNTSDLLCYSVLSNTNVSNVTDVPNRTGSPTVSHDARLNSRRAYADNLEARIQPHSGPRSLPEPMGRNILRPSTANVEPGLQLHSERNLTFMVFCPTHNQDDMRGERDEKYLTFPHSDIHLRGHVISGFGSTCCRFCRQRAGKSSLRSGKLQAQRACMCVPTYCLMHPLI